MLVLRIMISDVFFERLFERRHETNRVHKKSESIEIPPVTCCELKIIEFKKSVLSGQLFLKAAKVVEIDDQTSFVGAEHFGNLLSVDAVLFLNTARSEITNCTLEGESKSAMTYILLEKLCKRSLGLQVLLTLSFRHLSREVGGCGTDN